MSKQRSKRQGKKQNGRREQARAGGRKKADATASKKADATASKKADATASKKADATASKKADATASKPAAPVVMVIAGVGLVAAIVASGMLVVQHLLGLSLPGCGPGSGCAALANSVWGSIPGIKWPVSHVGLTYFLSVGAAWLVLGMRMVPPLQWIIRLGALLSAMYLVVMFTGEHFCLYCLITHLGNFAFWIGTERLPRLELTRLVRPVAVGAGLFAVSSVALFGVEKAQIGRVERDAEEQRQQSTQQIVAGGGADAAFTGRYLNGPAEAPIRIVIFSDYQCPDCRRIEGQVRQLIATRDDVSFSAKHFPMSSQCNPYWTGTDIHPNACWAARAAETAGRLRGAEGFYEMHEWLFDVKGSFTNTELPAKLTELGYDTQEFISLMSSQEMLDLVLEDIEEARGYGLHFTPMVFVNGVEMKGFMARDALINTVNDVAATNPEAATAAVDAPPPAHQKYVEDWEQQPVRPIGSAARTAWSRGTADGAVDVVVWGDLQEPNTAKLDQRIRQAIEERGDVRYRFLHYPMNDQCNPVVTRSIHPLACLAAQAAEAAGALEGEDGYWRMHDWLMDNQAQLGGGLPESASPQQLADAFRRTLERAAGELGFETPALVAAMQDPAAGAAIAEDAQAGKRLGARFIPWVYVNNRWVPRWSLTGHDIVGQILDAAGSDD
jgi:protein-disulfide isomerase/uncharacterized membrane protein